MIEILNKEHCVGCEACVVKCPRGCISFNEDSEGFRYPKVDMKLCIDCSICQRVCPVINQEPNREPLATYGAKHRDEKILLASSSGGLFTLLAEPVIERGGVVFGVEFDENWEARHSYTETKEGLVRFRGSKYIQSRVGDSYLKVEKYLRAGRNVLFSGTPCQIAGLNRFLGKEYDNLLTVDLICHGVPSPLVWRKYLCDTKIKNISGISFRDKCTGWSSSSLSISSESDRGLCEKLGRNIFFRGFIKDLYLRPSCHECPAKALKSGSDITIADYWGIEIDNPQFNDSRGVGLAIIATQRGLEVFESLDKDVIDGGEMAMQPPLLKSSPRHQNREKFFSDLINKRTSISRLITRHTADSFSVKLSKFRWRLKKKIKRIIRF